MIDYVLIMCGGAGKRLWPASNFSAPKPFLVLDGNQSLFLKTLHRAFSLNPRKKVVIVTGKGGLEHLERDSLTLSPEQQEKLLVLIEPEGKNTAPAIFLGALFCAEEGSKTDTMLVMGADYVIQPVEVFKEAAEKGARIAREEKLVVFGIRPTAPETGYGYIEAGAPFSEGFLVESFREKPDEDTASRYLESGRFYWNSGMFIYTLGFFLSQIREHCPELPQELTPATLKALSFSRKGRIAWAENPEALAEAYRKVPGISVDYALMEKSSAIAMVEGSFSWNDIGSWDVIAESFPPDTVGEVLEVSSQNNYVYSDLPVALCGVRDLIVTVKNGTVLICRKGSSQQVKELASRASLPPSASNLSAKKT